jgi:hypothetical protein
MSGLSPSTPMQGNQQKSNSIYPWWKCLDRRLWTVLQKPECVRMFLSSIWLTRFLEINEITVHRSRNWFQRLQRILQIGKTPRLVARQKGETGRQVYAVGFPLDILYFTLLHTVTITGAFSNETTANSNYWSWYPQLRRPDIAFACNCGEQGFVHLN